MRATRLPFALAALLPLIAATAGAQQVSPVQRLQILPAYDMRMPTAVWDGTQYLLIFESHPESQGDLGDLYLARLAPDGTLIGADATPLGLRAVGVPREPSVAAHRGSGRVLLAYKAAQGPFTDVAMAWVDAASQTALPAGGQALTSGDSAELRPSVGASQDSFLVAWTAIGLQTPSHGSGLRFLVDGTAIDDTPQPFRAPVRATENRPFVLGLPDGFWLAWDDDRSDDLEGFVRPILSTGPFEFAGEQRIASGPGRQSGLVAATLGENRLLIWQDWLRMGPDTWGVRLQPNLQPRGEPFLVAAVDGATYEPRVAGDEDGALVIWQELRVGRQQGKIRATRIDTAGRVLDRQGFDVLDVDENVREHAIAKGPDDEYLVAAIEATPVPRLVYAIVQTGLEAVPEPPPDAGVIVPDSGVHPDAAPSRDAGVPDASSPAPRDAGSTARPPPERDGGCRAIGGSGLGLWSLLLLTLGWARRLRSRA